MDLVLDKKFELIGDYMAELKPILDFGDEEIITDPLKLHTCERLLQLIVDEMVSINEYLIKKITFPFPMIFIVLSLLLAKTKFCHVILPLSLLPLSGCEIGLQKLQISSK